MCVKSEHVLIDYHELHGLIQFGFLAAFFPVDKRQLLTDEKVNITEKTLQIQLWLWWIGVSALFPQAWGCWCWMNSFPCKRPQRPTVLWALCQPSDWRKKWIGCWHWKLSSMTSFYTVLAGTCNTSKESNPAGKRKYNRNITVMALSGVLHVMLAQDLC